MPYSPLQIIIIIFSVEEKMTDLLQCVIIGRFGLRKDNEYYKLIIIAFLICHKFHYCKICKLQLHFFLKSQVTGGSEEYFILRGKFLLSECISNV